MAEDESREGEDHDGELKESIWRVIFLSNTRKSKAFDVILLWLISLSVLVIMLESVESLAAEYSVIFHVIEWVFTIVFTVEYAVRVWVVRRKRRYIFSFFGIVDLLSILPTYLTLFVSGSQFLTVIRILRLMRMFRILKMGRHVSEANVLWKAMRASGPKITVFLFGVVAVTAILGTVMYVVEGMLAKTDGFDSIPDSIYWAIVTISTVGYGDVTAATPIGKVITTIAILIGYGMIAVPTGIVTSELSRRSISLDERSCTECGSENHDPRAAFCKMCSVALPHVSEKKTLGSRRD